MVSPIRILPESLESALHGVVDRVNACNGGIRIILLSTSEGVPLGRVAASNDDHTVGEQPASSLDESVLASLESTWAPAPKQLALLKMSKIEKVTAIYEEVTLMHLYYTPVVVTLVLKPNSNLGAIQSSAIPLLEETLAPLCETLLKSLSPNGEWQDGIQDHYQ